MYWLKVVWNDVCNELQRLRCTLNYDPCARDRRDQVQLHVRQDTSSQTTSQPKAATAQTNDSLTSGALVHGQITY